MSSIDGKDPVRVAAGLKSTINNPNTSSEAKDNAAQRLEEINGQTGGGGQTNDYDESDLSTRQAAGYKATLSNPNTSSEAKRHAEEVLGGGSDATGAGVTTGSASSGSDDLHQTRVNAGYKATLKNPNVSEGAKEHARDVLAENDAL
ncbi:hypothetical protein PENSPDRAFT_684609 [Peniophora sp. CONT]|nr:hypothetical protein PENSPDRAFT_684609 [Peniophora sp. CONT]